MAGALGRMCGRTAFVIRRVLKRLVSKTAFVSLVVASSAAPARLRSGVVHEEVYPPESLEQGAHQCADRGRQVWGYSGMASHRWRISAAEQR